MRRKIIFGVGFLILGVLAFLWINGGPLDRENYDGVVWGTQA